MYTHNLQITLDLRIITSSETHFFHKPIGTINLSPWRIFFPVKYIAPVLAKKTKVTGYIFPPVFSGLQDMGCTVHGATTYSRSIPPEDRCISTGPERTATCYQVFQQKEPLHNLNHICTISQKKTNSFVIIKSLSSIIYFIHPLFSSVSDSESLSCLT